VFTARYGLNIWIQFRLFLILRPKVKWPKNSIKIFRSLPRSSGRYFVVTQNLSCSALLSGICVKNDFKISAQLKSFRRFVHSVIMLPSKCTTQSKSPVCFLCCISGFLCQHQPTSAPIMLLLLERQLGRLHGNFKQIKFFRWKKIFSRFRELNKNRFNMWNKFLFLFAD